MSRAADVAKQANARGIKTKVPLQVTPGSEMIRATIERDGQMQLLKKIGANVLANACGPCIGQWSRPELKKRNQIQLLRHITETFQDEMMEKENTMNFIGSPEIVVSLALGGRLSLIPINDQLTANDGTKFNLIPPKIAPEFPQSGFKDIEGIYVPPDDICRKV